MKFNIMSWYRKVYSRYHCEILHFIQDRPSKSFAKRRTKIALRLLPKAFFLLAVVVIFLFPANVFADSDPKINIIIKEARVEQIDRKIEKFVRKINDSLRDIPIVESMSRPTTKIDLKTNYSLREPKVKGVTDFKSRFNASAASSLNW